jgi:hypothetical protein
VVEDETVAKVHRAYRHSWWRRSKENIDCDYQAMCNFVENHVRLDAIAEYFGCSEAHVEEEIVRTNGYGYRRRMSTNASDWGAGTDALLTFQQVIRRLEQGEIRRMVTIDVAGFLEKEFGEDYITDGNIAIVEGVLEQILAYLAKEHGPDYAANNPTLVKGMLKKMIV